MHRLLLVLLLGCGGPAALEPSPSSLSEVLASRAALQFDSTSGRLVLAYNDLLGCRRLDQGVVATVNGEPLSVITRGYGFSDGEDPAAVCNHPEWAVPVRPTDELVTTFELSDATASVSAEFLAVSAPRTLTPKSGSNQVRRGELVELLWSPASDMPNPLGFTFTMSDGGVRTWKSENFTVGRVDARVQMFAPYASGTLTYSGWVSPGVGRCSFPLTSCSVVPLSGGVVSGVEFVVVP